MQTSSAAAAMSWPPGARYLGQARENRRQMPLERHRIQVARCRQRRDRRENRRRSHDRHGPAGQEEHARADHDVEAEAQQPDERQAPGEFLAQSAVCLRLDFATLRTISLQLARQHQPSAAAQLLRTVPGSRVSHSSHSATTTGTHSELSNALSAKLQSSQRCDDPLNPVYVP